MLQCEDLDGSMAAEGAACAAHVIDHMCCAKLTIGMLHRNKQHLLVHVQLRKHKDIKQSLIRIRTPAHTEGHKHRPGRAKQ